MENFDRENIDELLEIRQIRQYFPPSKICAIRYISVPTIAIKLGVCIRTIKGLSIKDQHSNVAK